MPQSYFGPGLKYPAFVLKCFDKRGIIGHF